MADRNSNLAYDIARYEASAERANARSNIRSRSSNKTGTSEFFASIPAILIIAAAGILLCFCISSKAEVAAVHATIIDAEADVADLEQENRRMITELEQKSSQKTVEDYAENVLGMQKLDKSQVEYISLESGNVVEINETESNVFTDIKHFIDSIGEYINQ